jgi:hypothetical protein
VKKLILLLVIGAVVMMVMSKRRGDTEHDYDHYHANAAA